MAPPTCEHNGNPFRPAAMTCTGAPSWSTKTEPSGYLSMQLEIDKTKALVDVDKIDLISSGVLEERSSDLRKSVDHTNLWTKSTDISTFQDQVTFYPVQCRISPVVFSFNENTLRSPSKKFVLKNKMISSMSNITFGEFNFTLMPSTSFLEQMSVQTASMNTASVLYQGFLQYTTWSTFWKILAVVAIAVNFKNFPLIYHLRILNGVRFVLKSQRSIQPLTPDHLFQPLITSSKTTLMETDVFGHKSNSTYFSDIDICRVHLVTTLFSKAIEDIRGSTTMNGLSRKPRSMFTLPLGAVSCCFRRELKPYESYDMWTRILSWDEKWVYLVTHFIKKGAEVQPEQYTLYPQQNYILSNTEQPLKPSKIGTDQSASKTSTLDGSNPAIAASGLSKIVFKNNRHTIRPETMLEAAGLLPKREDETVADQVGAASTREQLSGGSPAWLKDDTDGAKDRNNTSQDYWTRERIEAERQRGMKQAHLLAAQSELVHELNENVALGRHYDGHGIEGVAATLAQLGGISKYQLV